MISSSFRARVPDLDSGNQTHSCEAFTENWVEGGEGSSWEKVGSGGGWEASTLLAQKSDLLTARQQLKCCIPAANGSGLTSSCLAHGYSGATLKLAVGTVPCWFPSFLMRQNWWASSGMVFLKSLLKAQPGAIPKPFQKIVSTNLSRSIPFH